MWNMAVLTRALLTFAIFLRIDIFSHGFGFVSKAGGDRTLVAFNYGSNVLCASVRQA